MNKSNDRKMADKNMRFAIIEEMLFRATKSRENFSVRNDLRKRLPILIIKML